MVIKNARKQCHKRNLFYGTYVNWEKLILLLVIIIDTECFLPKINLSHSKEIEVCNNRKI